MGCLGNVLWFVFGGAVSGLSWCLAGCLWCITVVGIPVGMQCFKFAALSFFPFGKYDDKHNIDKVISALNIKSWKETEKSIGMNPKYTIKFYCDTTNQDEEKDIKEITLYENGEYATIFITSPGGVKQNYKTSIDISELVI